jgi:hypothetical protein
MPMMQILLAQNLKRSLFIDVDFFPSLHNSGMMQKKRTNFSFAPANPDLASPLRLAFRASAQLWALSAAASVNWRSCRGVEGRLEGIPIGIWRFPKMGIPKMDGL